MPSHPDIPLLRQLNASSAACRAPLATLDWNRLSLEDFWLPPSALSLFGSKEFDALPQATQRRLSQFEFLHFIRMGLWLESLFIQRLAKRLAAPLEPVQHAHHLHEIREEAGHGLMFLELMERSGLHLPAAHCPKPRLAALLGRWAPMDGALFWLAVVVGEEIPDKFNRHVRLSDDAANPLIRQMCTLHLIDEARHIAHARSMLGSAMETSQPLSRWLLSGAARQLIKQVAEVFYLPPVVVYELAGLGPGKKWHSLAQHNPARREFMRHCAEPTANLLRGLGLKFALHIS